MSHFRRISLRKCLQTPICLGDNETLDILFSIHIVTEFGEVVNVEGVKFQISIRKWSSSSSDWVILKCNKVTKNLSNYFWNYYCSLPAGTTPGNYQFKIVPLNEDVLRFKILHFYSDSIEIVQCESVEKSPLLSNYRILHFTSGAVNTCSCTLNIKETYGETIGSHIWDSGIVLSQYLLDNCSKQQYQVCLELGAGCGVTGISIFLLNIAENVILTDKFYQRSYLNQNILNNCSSSSVICEAKNRVIGSYPVDWESFDSFSVSNIFNEVRNEVQSKNWLLFNNQRSESANNIEFPQEIDLIIAADVLYDQSAAVALFNVLRKLATPNTCIYIAQKDRNDSNPIHASSSGVIASKACDEILPSVSLFKIEQQLKKLSSFGSNNCEPKMITSFDVKSVEDFNSEIVYEGSGVKIWELRIRTSL